MQNNYYFLKPLSRAIAQKLGVAWQLGFREIVAQLPASDAQETMFLATCFSQDKDELVLGFCHQAADFYVKAVLRSDFACLVFPEQFFRAKKNSVDLFPELMDLKVEKVIQFQNERSFALAFEQDYFLLFKMHGRRSNLVLLQGNQFVNGFHKKMEKDQSLTLSALDRPIEQSYEAFLQADARWQALFPTFGREMKQYLKAEQIDQQDAEKQWEILTKSLEHLENPPYYLTETDTKPQLWVIPPQALGYEEATTEIYHDPIEAVNEFYFNYVRISLLEKEKQEALRILQRKEKQANSYIEKNLERLIQMEESSPHEETANILMANLHQVPEGVKSVQLFDFYHNEERKIKLKPELSPQKNAEVYYRKAKNEKIEINSLKKNIERKEKELEEIQQHVQAIASFGEVKSLRKYLKNQRILRNQRRESTEQHLFKKFTYHGFDIWIGKNAKNNDLLTQQYAYKEDLWLHAKDVSGSHVLIKYQAGKPFPSDVIEKAASLAAYYSKRSSESLCPVIVTPRKFVRKTKDLAPGQVIVDKEEVIMVIPERF